MSNEFEATPEFWQTLNQSAQLLRQNRPGEAIALLEPLQRQAPDQVDVAINLGGAYILQRKWNRAIAVLRKAVEPHPQNAMLWANLAAAYLGNLETAGPRHQERAIKAYEQVLALDPAAPNVHYHLGLIYKERGDLEQAARYFAEALEIAPHDQDARRWLERVHTLQANQTQAQQNDDQQTDVDNPGNQERPA
ncbi:MAG TPA: tetratricopeptide repeat protein [Caldilineaceae bacterium]|mgnify:CR=1 FL=1|nr:tetratricopeptide repeat protein [Caldilineaceae bacterium]